MIEVSGLVKNYGSHIAVNHASFTIDEGEVVGFLGPNGAGKSTTMNILTGYLSATEGTVKINGYDILEEPNEAKRHIGYLPEQPPLYMDMTVGEYLNFVYDLKKATLPRKPHLAEICRLVRIDKMTDRLIRNLSKGYRQRVGIAQALVGNPEVLILDEPTVGLDPQQIIEIRNLITQLGRSHTVILSSHILSEIQAVCERILIINQGYIIADDTPAGLSESLSADHTVVADIVGPPREVKKALEDVRGVKAVVPMGLRPGGATEFQMEPAPDVDICRPLSEKMMERHWLITALYNKELSLEDMFLKLVNQPPEKAAKLYMEGKQAAEQAAAETAEQTTEQPDHQPDEEEEA